MARRSYRIPDPEKPHLVFFSGAALLEYCLVCFDQSGTQSQVTGVFLSETHKRRYQKCLGPDRHMCFLGKDPIPLVLAPGLGMPRIPPLLDRGSVPGGKRRCSAPDCTRSRGSSSCATQRCPKCCAMAGVTERLEGRDGSLLCPAHKKQIVTAIEALGLPPIRPANIDQQIEDAPAEALDDGFIFFSSQGDSTRPLTSPASRLPLAAALPPPPVASGSSIPSDANTTMPVASTSAPQIDPTLLSSPALPTPSTSTRSSKARDAPRAMPANLQFSRPGPSEVSRTFRASQRAHRPDTLPVATKRIRVVFWAMERSKIVVQVDVPRDGPTMIVISHHDILNTLVGKYSSEIIEVYDAAAREWVLCTTTMPWDLGDRSVLLLRSEGLPDSKCDGLAEEISHTSLTRPSVSTSSVQSPHVQSPSFSTPSFKTAPLFDTTPVFALKRKADFDDAPEAPLSKYAKNTDSGRMVLIINDDDNNENSTVAFTPPVFDAPIITAPLAKASRPGESFLLDLTISEVAGALEEIRHFKVIDGMELKEAFEQVFPGRPYVASTFLRHRNAMFWADPTVLNEWRTRRGHLPWRKWYNVRTDGTHDGLRNHWLATREEEEEIRRKKEQSREERIEKRRLAMEHRHQHLWLMDDDDDTEGGGNRRVAKPGEGRGGPKSAKLEPMDKEIVHPKPEPQEAVIPDASDSEEELDVQAQLARTKEKGKGWAVEIIDIADSSDSEEELDVQAQLARAKEKGKGRAVEIIELSDSDSE